MLKKLEVDKNKVLSPSREDMVQLLLDLWEENEVYYPSVFKKLFVTNKFDGTEDYLVSDKLFKLIGDDMLQYRRQLLNSYNKLTICHQANHSTERHPKEEL